MATLVGMATLRLFASVREAAGTKSASFRADTVEAVIAAATEQYGPVFAELVPTCRIWVNGEPALPTDAVSHEDEVALLPPVSGGAL